MFKWFEKNPPDTRIRTYFDGGLFDHGLSAMQCFVNIDKSPERRHRFCVRHSGGFERLERQCLHYRALVENLT